MKIIFMGWLTEIFDAYEIESDIQDKQNLIKFIKKSAAQKPGAFSGDFIENICFALNGEIVEEAILPDKFSTTDQITIFPPLTGG